MDKRTSSDSTLLCDLVKSRLSDKANTFASIKAFSEFGQLVNSLFDKHFSFINDHPKGGLDIIQNAREELLKDYVKTSSWSSSSQVWENGKLIKDEQHEGGIIDENDMHFQYISEVELIYSMLMIAIQEHNKDLIESIYDYAEEKDIDPSLIDKLIDIPDEISSEEAKALIKIFEDTSINYELLNKQYYADKFIFVPFEQFFSDKIDEYLNNN